MKRKGSFAIYCEPWHADIFDFLDLRKNQGKDEIRARDLFLALWTNDIFMTRVDLDEDWSLMCPHECPGLTETWGKEFNDLYIKYESEGRYKKKVKAREVWNKVLESQIETGTPYVLYKDSINEKSNQANIGLIRSSNLCAEIVEASGITKAQKDILNNPELLKQLNLEEFIGVDEVNETAVCNLASISLTKFVNKNKTYNFKKLYEVAYDATINLNNVIDMNYYPSDSAKFSNFCHRPIGLGVQGLSDVFFVTGIPHDSSEAKQLNRDIFETIYYAAMRASCDMAKEQGAYATYEGSPVSQGMLQFDLWGVTPSNRWDWEKLRADIKRFGVRNSLTTCVMPTASCFTSDGTILTSDGELSYREIMEKQNIDWKKIESSPDQGWIPFSEPILVQTRFGLKESNKIFYNGHKQVIEIELEDGKIFKCTENHKFLVNREDKDMWVEAGKLLETDQIIEMLIEAEN
jgi:ribonucleoside-diphosphate reductase alpha chain